MANDESIPAALSIEGLNGDARSAFDLAAESHYHGIAFATNHAELTPDQLGQSARRHIKTLLAGKHLGIDAIRISAPRGALADPATIDRTIDNAQKAFLLAHDLGVKTVSLNVGNLADKKIPRDTLIAAVRQLAQHADAAGLTLALGSEASEPLRSVLKAVDYDRAKANFDTARLISAGEDPLVVAEALAGVIGQVTAADVIRAGHAVRATFLGEGQLPLHELMEILEDQGFRGPMVVDVRDLPDGPAGARTRRTCCRNFFNAEAAMSDIAWRMHREGVVDSTNVRAAALIRQLWEQDQSAHGQVIVAERQTAGRGQHGRVWESPAGGLYLSAVVEGINAEARDKLALIAGVAVAYALQGEAGGRLGLRWPNDIMLDQKKLGGILCESVAQGNRWAGIIGIGLNIHVPIDGLPKEIRHSAASLMEGDGRQHDLGEIQLGVLGQLARVLGRVSDEGIAPAVNYARQLDMLRGKLVEVQDGERIVAGIADGLGDSGQLLVRTPNGRAEFTTGTLIAIAGEQLRG